LGTGGGSDVGAGTWFEGVVTQGTPPDEVDERIQADIVALGYGRQPDGGTVPGTAWRGPVQHERGARGGEFGSGVGDDPNPNRIWSSV
jgi:hypothetical protein